jgi:hypothetical protein
MILRFFYIFHWGAKKKSPVRRKPSGVVSYRLALPTEKQNIHVMKELNDNVNGRQNSGYALQREHFCSTHYGETSKGKFPR